MSVGLPEAVQRLVSAWIDSVETLQVLVFMRDNAGKRWTSPEVTSALQMDQAAVSGALVRLRQRGFLTVELEEDARYQYAADGELAAAVDQLRDCFRTRPFDLAALIAARPTQRLRLFADAFRLRKDD